jgi:hypothetical protein
MTDFSSERKQQPDRQYSDNYPTIEPDDPISDSAPLHWHHPAQARKPGKHRGSDAAGRHGDVRRQAGRPQSLAGIDRGDA